MFMGEKPMKIDEIIKQAKFCSRTLNSGCVTCDEKVKDFYKSVIGNLEVLEILKPFLKIEETGDDLFPFEHSISSNMFPIEVAFISTQMIMKK